MKTVEHYSKFESFFCWCEIHFGVKKINKSLVNNYAAFISEKRSYLDFSNYTRIFSWKARVATEDLLFIEIPERGFGARLFFVFFGPKTISYTTNVNINILIPYNNNFSFKTYTRTILNQFPKKIKILWQNDLLILFIYSYFKLLKTLAVVQLRITKEICWPS